MSIGPASGISGVTSLLHRGGRAAVLVLAGNLLLWASAKTQVPFWPVPATMQSLVVLLLGCAYGARLGAAAVVGFRRRLQC
jgi:biotin transport system substrate-specific component